MNKEDYNKYYIQGSDHYLIPKYEFDELFNEMSNWKEEAKELKKQLEELKSTNKVLSEKLTKDKILKQDCLTTCCGIPIGDIPKLINQQKKFIKYLEDEFTKIQNDIEKEIDNNVKYFKVERRQAIAKILQKYKEIIGVPMAGLDDEEEPDLFEMIEDMKNKFKHIEEINKSYPIFNFDKKSFEVMKDMLQDVYSKQVEIIKSVNYLFDKDERQHRKNNESPAELN